MMFFPPMFWKDLQQRSCACCCVAVSRWSSTPSGRSPPFRMKVVSMGVCVCADGERREYVNVGIVRVML